MRRRYMGVERSTFIIDPASRIARIFEKVTPLGHATEIAEALRELQSS